MRRLLLWLGVPLSLVAVLLLAAGYALHAPGGLRIAFDWLAERVPGALDAREVEGSLAGPWRISGLRYHDAQGIEVTLDEASLAWRPAALLGGLVRIEALRGAGLHIRMPASDPESPAGDLPSLPLRIDADVIGLERIEVTTEGGSPLQIERIGVTGGSVSRLRGVRVKSLQVASAMGDLQLSGRLDPWRDDRHDLQGEVRIAWPGQPEIAGTFHLVGNRQLSRLSAGIASPLSAQLELRLDTPLDVLAWEGRLTARSEALQALDPGLPAWPAELGFDGSGTLARFAGSFAASVTHPELGKVAAQGAVDGDPARLGLGQVTLRAGDPQMRLRLASGTIDIAGPQPRIAATGSWQALRWPLAGPAQAASPNGRFEVSGTPGDYALDLAGRVELPGQPGLEIELEGNGSTLGIDLARWTATLDGQGGRLLGEGQATWSPGLAARVRGRVEQLDPGRFAGGWPGRLDGPFRAEAEGGETLSWTLHLDGLEGMLRDRPLGLRGRVQGAGTGVALHRLEVAAGALEATLDGRVAPELELRWEAESEALDGLLGVVPGLEGRAKARGTLAGAPAAPEARFTLEAGELAYAGYEIGTLTASGGALAGLDGALELDLEALDVTLQGSRLSRVTLDGRGTRARHRVTLDAVAEGQQAAFALQGALDRATWRGELVEGRLARAGWGALVLDGPAAVQLSVDEAVLADHCWQRREEGAVRPGSLCSGARWRRDGAWQAELRLAELPLGLFDLALPEGLALAGEVAGEARFAGTTGGALTGRGELRVGPGHVDLATLLPGSAPLAYHGGSAQLVADGEGTVAAFRVDFAGDDRVTGRVALPGVVPGQPFAADPVLEGEIDVALARTDLLTTLLPGLGFGPGQLDGTLELGGTLGVPRVTGAATLALEAVEVPQYGVVLEEVRLTARGDGEGRLRLEGGARSGEGAVHVDGELLRDPEATWQVALALSGERFTAVDLGELHLVVSPDFELNLRGRDLALTGTLAVPEALIRPQLGGVALENASTDTVVVGVGETRVRNDPLYLDARVRLVLGEGVRFEGFGLKGRIAGALDIVQRPDAIPLGNGELRLVEGSFNRYGQDLRIESGRLQFANSPIDDPGIEAEAVREVGQVRAGVRLSGTLSAMETTVFSDPPMSQNDALSYLVTGAPAGQSGGSDAGKVAAASAALGYLAERTGIDALSIESEGVGDTMSLVVGQYLSPEFYVGYAVGLTTPTNTFIARYRLTERLSVEASSGTGSSGAFSGGDLIYEIER